MHCSHCANTCTFTISVVSRWVQRQKCKQSTLPANAHTYAVYNGTCTCPKFPRFILEGFGIKYYMLNIQVLTF